MQSTSARAVLPETLRSTSRRDGSLRWGQVIGLPVAAATMDILCKELVHLASVAPKGHVCVANAHMLTEARGDPDLRRVLEDATIVTSDGMPLAWTLRLQGLGGAERVRGPDMMLGVCRLAAAKGVPVYFYGGDEDTMDGLRSRLGRDAPGLIIAGIETPPMLDRQPEVDPNVVGRIRDSGARIVFVGLGCPKQEFWMHAYGEHLDAVLIGVGQAFNIAAGQLAQAPLWMQRNGFEWLYRLASEPGRLWQRYLVGNSLFIWYSLTGLLTRRHQPS